MTINMIIIIGMAIVTLVPRFLPAFIVDRLHFPRWINRWLNAIPYAALGALIFPGIMNQVKPGEPWVGLTSALVAILLAFTGLNIIFVVIGAIATVFIFSF